MFWQMPGTGPEVDNIDPIQKTMLENKNGIKCSKGLLTFLKVE